MGAVHFEFDATKLKLAPIPTKVAELVPYARALDKLAQTRAARSVSAVLSAPGWTTAAALREALTARHTQDLADLQRMIGLQEELDWACYRVFGLDGASDALPPEDAPAVPPNWLAWALDLAARDEATRAALARGDETTEIPTAWFTRHGWAPLLTLPEDAPPGLAARVAARRARIAANPELRLIEQPAFKRRWYKPDFVEEERAALRLWLADRVEAIVRERLRPATIDDLTAALQADARALAVAEVLTGRRDFSLGELVAEVVHADAVPNHPFHIFKDTGLKKWAAWEETWADQRREDAGEAVTPKVPPHFSPGDFLKPEVFRLRGKLNVPKERFITFTEVPGDGPTLYGWAGWTPTARLKALLALDERLEDAGHPLNDRVGLLDAAWRLLPEVAREDAAAAARLKAELSALVGAQGLAPELLAAWQANHPPPGTGRGKKRAR
jgi:hypothetical protein